MDPHATPGAAELSRPHPLPKPLRHVHDHQHLLRLGLRPSSRPHPGPGTRSLTSALCAASLSPRLRSKNSTRVLPSPGHWTGAGPCDPALLSSARPPRQVTNRMFLAVWFIGVPTRYSIFKFEIVAQLSPNVLIFSNFLIILFVKLRF